MFAQQLLRSREGQPGEALAQVLRVGAGEEDVFLVLHAGAGAACRGRRRGRVPRPAR